MADPNPDLLTADEAAARLGVTRSYLYRLIKRGILPEAIGIRNGREVKLIPADALRRLSAAEGLLVRDVDDGALPAVELRPATDPPLTAPPATPAPPAASLTSHSVDSDMQFALVGELRAELRALRQQLTEERAARQELEARLARHNPASDELATAIGRANEVTALVKASEIKQSRILEEFLAQQKWGRARKIGYVAYLVIASAASIATVIWIFRIASEVQTLLTR